MAQYEPVIGLEIHAQLLTASKLFCRCPVEFGAPPNQNVCPTCLGLPGALPVGNRSAIAMAVRAALALGCAINPTSSFARKQYFYPDLPKGYQISQYERPFSRDGRLEIETSAGTRMVGITRVHLEEDAGKNIHGVGGDSLVDLNRAGTPLIEIVSEPDMRSSAQASAYMRAVHEILWFLAVNDGNLEEGSFRCDANVSIRPSGQEAFGTRVELKNLNSFRFIQRAIDCEIARQSAVLDAGGVIEQETRSYDPETNTTKTLRSKEEAHDYRYFPDPDLPPLVIGPGVIEEERTRIGTLPAELRQRWVTELGLSASAATTLTQHPAIARFFEDTLRQYPDAQKAANWIGTEVLRGVKTHGQDASFPVTPGQVAELLGLVDGGEISGKQAKEVYAAIEGTDTPASAVVKERGLRVVSDSAQLGPICQQVLKDNPKQVAAYRSGKTAILGYFVGQVMKATAGAADPRIVSETLRGLLDADA